MRRRRSMTLAGLAALTLVFGAPAAHAQDGVEDVSTPAVARSIVDGGLEWHLRDSLTPGPATNTFRYGRPSDDHEMLCDWNGDGTQTPGVIRTIDGRPYWLLRDSNSAGWADHAFVYGRDGDIAVCGDWDGDGQQTPGVVRVGDDGTYTWYLRDRLGGGAASMVFEFGQDQYPGRLPPAWPVVGDWNGDGSDTIGIVQGHPEGQMQWQLRDVTSAGEPNYDFVYYAGGVWGDHLEMHVPVVGDWNGDGHDGPGVARASVLPGSGNLEWLLRNDPSAGFADHFFSYGRFRDSPLSWQ